MKGYKSLSRHEIFSYKLNLWLRKLFNLLPFHRLIFTLFMVHLRVKVEFIVQIFISLSIFLLLGCFNSSIMASSWMLKYHFRFCLCCMIISSGWLICRHTLTSLVLLQKERSKQCINLPYFCFCRRKLGKAMHMLFLILDLSSAPLVLGHQGQW